MPEGEENPPSPISPFIVPSVEAGLLPKKKKKNKKSFIDLHELSLIFKCHEMHGRKKTGGRMGD